MQYGLLKEDYFQWDTGQRVELFPDGDDEITELHMYNDRIGGLALVMEVKTDENGTLYADIPDLLFRLAGRIIFWRVVSNEDGTSTKEEFDGINVIPRAKPTDYVYTAPDVLNYKELLALYDTLTREYQELLQKIADGKIEGGCVLSVNGYTGKVTITAADVGALTEADLQTAIEDALAEAKASGEFDGEDGHAGTGVTVIRETNYEVLEIEGTVLDTKMTPAEVAEAAKGEVVLSVLSDDGVYSYVYALSEMLDDGTELNFYRSDEYASYTIRILVAADGTMTVGQIANVGHQNGGASLTKTTLWEGAATIAAESSGGSIPLTFTPSDYDYYDVYVSYGGYGLAETAVRCYPVKSYSGSDAIAGRLIWNTMYWLQLDVYIQATGGILLGCLYRSPGSTSFMSGANSFTISKIVGVKQ